MRPYITLKWAQTADGFIARTDYSSRWISCEESRELVHQWRASVSAILVGTTTALHDDPQLTVRTESITQQPHRIVIDRFGRLPAKLHLFDQTASTIVLTCLEQYPLGALLNKNFPIKVLRYDGSVKDMLEKLYLNNITSLLCEGGSLILSSLITEGYWDEARVFIAPQSFRDGIKAPYLTSAPTKSEQIGADKLLWFVR